MSWEDQGRQEHGWFGNGTAPVNPKDGASGATSTNTSRGDLATALAYTDGLRRSMDRPATTDPKLSAIMDEMYRPNAKVGSGSTAAAVKSEKATGQPVAGKWHTQKAEEGVIRLQNWLRANPTASPSDRAVAENVLRDLQNALAGK